MKLHIVHRILFWQWRVQVLRCEALAAHAGILKGGFPRPVTEALGQSIARAVCILDRSLQEGESQVCHFASCPLIFQHLCQQLCMTLVFLSCQVIAHMLHIVWSWCCMRS